jgi:DNA-binding CsgD family transcriptional regulator/tetratricopeptide (TPR) repeat protein
MTFAVPAAERAAIDEAQLRLALASVSYMNGRTTRSRAEAEAVLAEPGLPAVLYAAAEQRRVLAWLADESVGASHDTADWNQPESEDCRRSVFLTRAALAWRDGCVSETLELLWAATRAAVPQGGGGYPALGLAAVFSALGQFDDAHACVLAAADEIALGGDPLWAAAPALFAARVDLAAGQLDAARAAAQSGLKLADELGTPMLAPIAHDVLVAVALRRGELGEAVDQFERWPAGRATGRLPFGSPRRHWTALCVRGLQEAALLGDGAVDAAFDLVSSDRCLLIEEPSAAAWLARAAADAGDHRRARLVVRSVEQLADANPRYPSVLAAAAHAAGVAHRDSQRLTFAAIGHRSLWARAVAAEDAAELQAAEGDRAAARAWFERALAEYSRCGATAAGGRVRARLRALGVRPHHWSRQQRPVWGWESLTGTERAVAELVAEGLSNQQVATRMFLSRHTVDFHLRHIFRKLGIESRVVLTRIALAGEEVRS